MDEKELKELLLCENDEFRKTSEGHQDCEEELKRLNKKPCLTDEEESLVKDLKKKKLALKDKMYVMMFEYRKSH